MPLAARITPIVQRQVEEEEEEELLQAKPDIMRRVSSNTGDGEVPPIVHRVLHSPGQPLDAESRTWMEPRFGHDFSTVRVHTGSNAAQAAQRVNAQAFTIGHDVVFGNGQYAPQTANGKRLLAHELSHVVQQQAATPHASISRRVCPLAAPVTIHDAARARSSHAQSPELVSVQHRVGVGAIQRVAPAAAAGAGIGLFLKKCAIGAIVGVLTDLGFQAALHMWRHRTWRFWEMTVDVCSLIISAVLGCVGGISAVFIERWIATRIGASLAGVTGTLLGKILIWLAQKAGVGIPKALLKTLFKLGCVSEEQAEVISPGITAEGRTASAGTTMSEAAEA